MIHVIDSFFFFKKQSISSSQVKLLYRTHKKKYFEGNEVINVLSGKIIER